MLPKPGFERRPSRRCGQRDVFSSLSGTAPIRRSCRVKHLAVEHSIPAVNKLSEEKSQEMDHLLRTANCELRTSIICLSKLRIVNRRKSSGQQLNGFRALWAMAIILHYREDKTIADIARIMRVRKNTVKTYLFRGREKLKSTLAGKEF